MALFTDGGIVSKLVTLFDELSKLYRFKLNVKLNVISVV